MVKKPNAPPKKPTPEELQILDREILFMEGLLRRDQNFFEALEVLGNDYTRRGRYADGLKIDLRLCKLRPDNALAHYNLACSHSLTEQITQAARALETAIDLGYFDFKHMIRDPDLENLRAHAAFKKILARARQIQIKPR